MDEYGVAFTSPDWSSHGLLGSQGWSPDTSFCSEEGDDAFMEQVNGTEKPISRRGSSKSVGSFPLPPVRGLSVKPRIAKAASAIDLKVIQDLQAWSFDGGANDNDVAEVEIDADMDGGEMDALHIISNRMNRMRPSHIDMPPQYRRVFSAPAPHSLSGAESDDDESCSDPGEYPFPYMIPFKSVECQRTVSQQDEDVKLQRLQASLSLLSVDGHADSDDAENPIVKGLEIMSPEQSAPSLAEQMAYACSLGNQFAWSTPAKIDLSSPSGLYLPSSASDASTFAQEERKMASRHVRQVVAANGSAPMPRSVSMQSALMGEAAEVGSSWSHKGYEDDEATASESETGCDVDDDEEEEERSRYWLRTETPMNRMSMSQHSHSASMASMASSPILHGPLSARDFESQSSSSGSESDSPSTCTTSAHSSEQSDSLMKTNTTTSCSSSSSSSPNSLHEFSYITDSDHFVSSASLQDRQSAQDDGFNGCTFSPALQTPDVEDMPPMPIGSAPSPVMEQSSLEPEHDLMSKQQQQHFSKLPTSFSTSSVLERPRPICRGSTLTPFFGKEMESSLVEQMMTRSLSTSSVRRVSECPRPRSVASSMVNAPQDEKKVEQQQQHRQMRLASSLQASEMYTSKSMSAFVEKDFERGLFQHGSAASSSSLSSPSPANPHHISLERLVAATPKKVVAFASMNSEYMISARNSFAVGGSPAPRLSNKALAQVREACRARENHARNVELERMHREDQQQQHQQQKHVAQKRPASFFSSMSRSHASEPVLSTASLPSRPTSSSSSSAAQQEVKKSSDKALPLAPTVRQCAAKKEQVALVSPPAAPIIHRQRCTYSISDNAKVLLPTLLVARTEYQRRRGFTGVPETEPAALALAKMNIRSAIPTRSSTAEGLVHNPHLVEQGGLPNMPHGVVLIVEEKFTNCTRTLA